MPQDTPSNNEPERATQTADAPYVPPSLRTHWRQNAELWARILENPDCPPSFYTVFNATFIDVLLETSHVSLTSPDVIRIMWPLAMENLVINGQGETGDIIEKNLIAIAGDMVPHDVYEPARVASRAVSSRLLAAEIFDTLRDPKTTDGERENIIRRLVDAVKPDTDGKEWSVDV